MVEDFDTHPIQTKAETYSLKLNGNSAMKSNITKSLDEEVTTNEPPDGGTRAILVMLASFFCNGILFGVINSYGVFYSEFHDSLQERNVTNAAGKAALVGSFAMGTTFFISPVAGVLTDFIGIRKTTFLGGAIAASGMFLSSFCVNNIVALCFTYGIMYGLGGALAYTPSLAVLGHYFKKYLGLVNGLVTAGSSLFTIAMPYIIDACIKHFGIVWALRLLAVIASLIMVAAFLFKPVTKSTKRDSISCSDIFNMEVISNLKYIIWTSIIALSLFGYFVPYVYMLKFVKSNFPDYVDNKLPVLCIGITSGVGRLIFGFIADRPGVNRILLQQLAFFCIGILTILLPFTAGHYPWLILIVLGMGIFDGCFIAVLGPIAFDICGRSGATQGIGFLLGVCSIPLTIGPYVAGVILDHTGSYMIPFILAGIPPTVGSIALFLTRCVRSKPVDGTIANQLDKSKYNGYPHEKNALTGPVD